MPPLHLRVLNGCSWELKSEFGNENGPKTAEQQMGGRPVLILGVKVSHAVGGGPKRGRNTNLRASCAHFRGTK